MLLYIRRCCIMFVNNSYNMSQHVVSSELHQHAESPITSCIINYLIIIIITIHHICAFVKFVSCATIVMFHHKRYLSVLGQKIESIESGCWRGSTRRHRRASERLKPSRSTANSWLSKISWTKVCGYTPSRHAIHVTGRWFMLSKTRHILGLNRTREQMRFWMFCAPCDF